MLFSLFEYIFNQIHSYFGCNKFSDLFRSLRENPVHIVFHVTQFYFLVRLAFFFSRLLNTQIEIFGIHIYYIVNCSESFESKSLNLFRLHTIDIRVKPIQMFAKSNVDLDLMSLCTCFKIGGQYDREKKSTHKNGKQRNWTTQKKIRTTRNRLQLMCQ